MTLICVIARISAGVEMFDEAKAPVIAWAMTKLARGVRRAVGAGVISAPMRGAKRNGLSGAHGLRNQSTTGFAEM